MARLAILVLLLSAALAPTAAVAVDFYTLPGIRWFFGFGNFEAERKKLEATLACDKKGVEKYELTGSRFACLFGDRNTVQVFLEDASTEPGKVKRVVFAWRTTAAIATGQAQSPFAADDRQRAIGVLRQVATLYLAEEAEKLVALMGQPATGQVRRRGITAVYTRLLDANGERYLVEFRDDNTTALRAREASDDKAGLELCERLIRQVPRFRNVRFTTDQRARQEIAFTAFLMFAEEASLMCEFYPTGYYRIMVAERGSENYIVAAHGTY